LLHLASFDQAAQIDGREPDLVDQLRHLGLRGCVISGQEDDPASARLARLLCEESLDESDP